MSRHVCSTLSRQRLKVRPETSGFVLCIQVCRPNSGGVQVADMLGDSEALSGLCKVVAGKYLAKHTQHNVRGGAPDHSMPAQHHFALAKPKATKCDKEPMASGWSSYGGRSACLWGAGLSLEALLVDPCEPAAAADFPIERCARFTALQVEQWPRHNCDAVEHGCDGSSARAVWQVCSLMLLCCRC